MCSSKEKTTWYNYYIFLICVPLVPLVYSRNTLLIHACPNN